METTGTPKTSDGQHKAVKHLHTLEKVRGIFVSLTKFVNAQALYQRNNPNLVKFANAFDQAFRAFFEDENELLLTVEQYQLLWRDEVVYDIGISTDSIAFLFYKDGVGEITIHSSVTKAELEQFIDILKSELYETSPEFDIVTKLWQSEFANIFYRVLDEQLDGAAGQGDGAGNTAREQPISADDHHDLPDLDKSEDTKERRNDVPLESLAAYINNVLDINHPGASAQAKEAHLQRILKKHFASSQDELTKWHDEMRAVNDRDELVSLLTIMLEFTDMRNTPPVVRDITDTIDRLVHYIKDEANIATLMATLDLVRGSAVEAMQVAFASLPERIESEITDSQYLLSLAQAATRSDRNDYDILTYFERVGANAVAALRGLLTTSTNASIHTKACDVLLDVARDDIPQIVDECDIATPRVAEDVVYLLREAAASNISPAIERIISSPEARIRECAIEYLLHLASEESIQLLCDFLRDANEGVRIKTLVALEGLQNPRIVTELTTLCVADHTPPKSTDELEHLFRALGKCAGQSALPFLKQTVAKKRWILGGRNRRNKLLGITALRHIPGTEARSALEKLSHDRDNLVRTKALHMLKQRGETTQDGDKPTLTGAGTNGGRA